MQPSSLLQFHSPSVTLASTKAFTSQVIALALFTLKLARKRDLSVTRGREIAQALHDLPAQVKAVLDTASKIEDIAEEFKRASNFLYLGRGYNFPGALEGALKLKEISYIHAEGYPAAEMKHGPIALIDEMMPVVFIAPHDAVFDKVVSNIHEVKARKGKTIVITSRDEPALKGLVDYEIRIPETVDMLMPILAAVPLQLLAYYIAVKRGSNVDQPRNLTPSVWYAQTTYPYDFSRNPIFCREVEAKHLDWLIHGLERAGIVVSADTIYTVWLKGLTGGSKLIRAGHIPESAYRVANCYDSR